MKDAFDIFMESWDQDNMEQIEELMHWDYREYKILLQPEKQVFTQESYEALYFEVLRLFYML